MNESPNLPMPSGKTADGRHRASNACDAPGLISREQRS